MEITIERLAYGGDGVARPAPDEPVVFAPRTAPGDRARVEIVETKPRFRRARVLEILAPGPDRVEPPCPHYRRGCGGCQLQHLSYDAQAKAKEEHVRDALRRIGGLEVRVAPIVRAPKPLGYRNKATFHWSERDARWALVAADGATPVPIPDCPLLVEAADRVFREAIAISGDGPYAELLVRAGEATGDTMVAVTLRSESPDVAARFAKLSATSVLLRVDPHAKRRDAFLQEEAPDEETGAPKGFRVLAGKNEIRERIGDATFLLDAETFLQVNTTQAAALFARARDAARLSGSESVLDLYCGNGGIALNIARRAKQVTGIESVAAAVDRGRRSAVENGIENVRFRRGRVETVLKKMHHAERVKPDVVFLDPPRAGAKPAVLDALARMAPKRIVYVSCNPATLARDLKTLVGRGYAARDVVPVDLFPQTYHVECVAALEPK